MPPAATSGPRPPGRRACSTTRWSRSRSRSGAATRSRSAGTRACGPTPRRRPWPSCARSCRAGPSPRATPASRTTRPRRAWWWPRTGSGRSAWNRWATWPGWAAAGCRRPPWASVPFRPSRNYFPNGPGFPRHQPRRAQRGIRGPGTRRPGRLGLERAGPAQRQRIRHLARPPHRRHRRPDACHRPA